MGQSAGQIALEIVGTVVGAYFDYPELGFALGGAIGGAAFPQKLDGPHTRTMLAQNATYGAMLPFGKGNFRVAGTLIWQLPIVEAGTNTGKGGPQVTQYSYYGYFAVAIHDGPIRGVRRIWANGILIYDISTTATIQTLLASGQFAATYLTIHTGEYTQLADPTIQSALGVANTPAYRGTAYIVFRRLPLQNFGNVLPSINVEVVSSDAAIVPAKIWQNNATGFAFGSFANQSFLTGFANGMVRAVKKSLTTSKSIAGTYRLNISNGSLEPVDSPNNFELNIASGALFVDNAAQPMGLVMPHVSTTAGVYSRYVGDTSTGNIVGHASTTTNASIYVSDNNSGTLIGDVLPCLTIPPITGTWRAVATFPCADWTHLAVITKGSGGGNTARYFKVGGNNQITQLGSLVYSGSVGVGWDSIYADGGVLVDMSDNYAHALAVTQLGAIQTVPLSHIVVDICERCGIPAGNIDATALTDGVWGFVIDRQMTGRAALEVLTPAFWFDAVESDTVLKFVKRSATSAATIPLADMGAETGGKLSTAPLVFTRGSEIELPTQINLTYYAVAASYQQGLQYARRTSTSQQNNIKTFDSAAVMDDTQAAVAAAILLWDALAGRTTFKFSTGFKWAQLEPTDVITVPSSSESYLARIMRKTEAGGKIDWEVVACAPVYSQSAAGGAITAGQTVSGPMTTTLVIMDIPPLRDADGASTNLYVAMWGLTGWPGAVLFRSADAGITWTSGPAQASLSTVGQAMTALGNWTGGNLFDEANTVDILLDDDTTLASLPELSVLNGSHVALLGNEIFQFKNAPLVSGSLYRLSGFLRGRFGTEAAMAGHGIGETFVLLTGVIQIQATPTSDIGQPRLYQPVTNGQAIGSGPQTTISEAGNTLRCWSPVLLAAGGAGYYSDIILTWTRRNRITWQWLPSVDEPMSEATEQYLVSIFSCASVIRTFTVNGAQTVTYTQAQQITDFGGSGLSTITFGVQQISAVVGAGVMAKATIALASHYATLHTMALSVSAPTSVALTLSKTIGMALSVSAPTSASLTKTTVLGSTFDPAKTQSGQTLSNNNLTISTTTAPAAANRGTQSTTSHSTGKYYVEITDNTGGASLNNALFLGACDSNCAGKLTNTQNIDRKSVV